MSELDHFIELDRAVDDAEDQGITARWIFGRDLLMRRVGKKLPSGMLDELALSTGKSRSELKFRMRFAELFDTEKALANAVSQYGSWHEIVNSAFASDPPAPLDPPEPLTGLFSTVVIDPPWPMEKIKREVRPNQPKTLDYLPMDEDELRDLEVPAAANAHLYLWTTHRFLPLALELAEEWGFAYQCLLTWRKNVGITPYSFMYSTEHVVFARRGSLDLLVKGRRLDFEAKVREHSRKPNEFYDLVRDVSPGPRVDMFAREVHDGFEGWGNETTRFTDAA